MKKIIPVVVAVALVASLLAASCAPRVVEPPAQVPKTITIVDEEGRILEIPQPLERIIVFNRYNMELVRALGGWRFIVGLCGYSTKEPDYVPGFDIKNTVGKQMEPDYEKIVALEPQVVIFPRNGAWAEAEEKLKPLGIRVAVFTGWDPSMFVDRVSTLGLMLDRKERAQELIDFYQKHIDLIQNKVKTLEKKKKVYAECEPNAPGSGDYRTCLVGSGHHLIIELAGGINIFGDINFAEQPKGKGSVSASEIDPEAIVVRNPQLVWKHESFTYIPSHPDKLKECWERLVSRPGWAELEAVKNNQVYVTSGFLTGACGKMVGVCYMAKWLYPELFPDLDPDAVMKEWIEEYQGVEYKEGYIYTPSLSK